mgnify:CR=1 FL=1
MNMLKIFKVGDELTGYCSGYFGRDSYEDKTCILVTVKGAVFENESGYLGVVNNPDESLYNDSRGWFK